MHKVLKTIGYILGSIFILLLLLIIFLNTRYAKHLIRDKAVAFLRKKLKTEVYIGELGYGLPKMVVLKDVLFKDQARDTLLAAHELRVDIDMLKLLKKQVSISRVHLAGIHAHLYRNAPDTNFNFTYIINAFSGSKPKKEKSKAVKDTSSAPFVIDIRKLVLDDIHIRFDDYTGGTRLALDLDKLNLGIKKMDLDSLNFKLKDLSVSGLRTVFLQDTSYLPAKPDTGSSNPQFRLSADNIDLQHIAVHYGNDLNKMLFDLHLGKLELQPKLFDLAAQKAELDKLQLDSTQVKIVMGPTSDIPAKAHMVADTLPQSNWHIIAHQLQLKGVNFAMDNDNEPRQKAGMDYAHLNVTKLALEANDILYTGDTINGDIKHLSAKEQSGLDLYELHTRFAYNPRGAALKDLYLQTPNTILQHYVQVAYPSLVALKNNMGSMMLALKLENSIIGIQDILLFAPQLQEQDLLKRNCNGRLKLDAAIYGYMRGLNINELKLSGLGNTVVDINGKLDGLPDADKLHYDLNITQLQSSRNDIEDFVPARELSQIRLPNKFSIKGTVSGTTKDYKPALILTSTDGNAALKGYVNMSPGKGKEHYDLLVKTQSLDLGRILKKDTLMGEVTADISIRGKGLDLNTMTAALDGAIQSANLKGYTYHDIKLKGKVAAKQADIKLNSNDPNARLSINAHADLRGKYAALKGTLQMDSIDFRAIHLYKTALRTRGTIDIDFPELNPDYPDGILVWRNPVIAANGQRYTTDSLYVSSKPSADTGQNIVLDFDALKAHITGKTPLTKLGDIIQENVNRHYMGTDTTNGFASLKHPVNTDSIPSDYELDLTANVSDRPILHGILPDLKSLDTVHIDGKLKPSLMVLNIIMPQVTYGSNEINKAEAHVNGSDSSMTYKVKADEISAGSLHFFKSTASGDITSNSVSANISIADSADKERFALAASVAQQGDTQVIQLGPGLVLNYDTWNVSESNKIAIAKEGLYVQNFGISNGGQYLKANSETPTPNAPVKVDISNFLLGNITEIISKDTNLLANGVLRGNINIAQIKPEPKMTGTLQVENLSVLGDTVGNLHVDVNSAESKAIDAKVKIDGRGNDILLSGLYYPTPVNNNSFDMDLNMNALSLQSMEGLTGHEIKNSSGFIRGKLHIKGMADAPLITGQLHTDQLSTTVAMLNAIYRMPDEKIVFTEEGPEFTNFKILDSSGNKAVIDGKVLTKNYRDLQMALHVKARDWHALHSTSVDNDLFYGDLFLSTDLDIKGPPTAPNVDGSLNILKDTKFTVTIPQKDPGLESRQGIVKFVDMSDTADRYVLQPKPADTAPRASLSPGSDVNVNIKVDKDAEFSVIIDKATGDFLRVRGVAALNTSVDPAGNLMVTGTYELNEGTYQFNYNFIKRRFEIQKGSMISLAGDPLDAKLDITAVYDANVPPYELVEKQVPDPAQLNYYKQRLPFQVQLILKGNLMKPDITFNIVLPENKIYRLSAEQIDLVQSKLSQMRTDTSELNKQVFALLILNRFVAEDPFSSGSGTDAAFVAKQSVGRFVSEQLNKLAGGLIKGIDLTLDLASSEDYTTGERRERTDLNVAASKRLLNDRLKVTVGNNFELEGPQTANTNQNTSYIPGNLAADYDLTPNGRYVVRAYRQEQDEGVLEGYVTETGLNFIVSLDYNKFRNIFRKHHRRKNTEGKDNTNKADTTGK
jgi:hypothetical protein